MQSNYDIEFSKYAAKQYSRLDNSTKIKVEKKILKSSIKNKKRRHLKFGKKEFVDNVGQYRIISEIIPNQNLLLVKFIGKHKDYEDYLG